ncbi:hypothetical protein HYV83_01810 [Candidatus Woesearchaeota archaeon]|nr:hypothetical protein [Candidatus Woesearchaeota archaeon]
MTEGRKSANLEFRILNFNVPNDWATPTGPGASPHDQLQRFLRKNRLWSEKFRYGCADLTLVANQELEERGVSTSQLELPDGTVKLHSIRDSRDFYCNAGFFTGYNQIVIYNRRGLESKNSRSYLVSKPSALIAVVKPV